MLKITDVGPFTVDGVSFTLSVTGVQAIKVSQGDSNLITGILETTEGLLVFKYDTLSEVLKTYVFAQPPTVGGPCIESKLEFLSFKGEAASEFDAVGYHTCGDDSQYVVAVLKGDSLVGKYTVGGVTPDGTNGLSGTQKMNLQLV